MNDQLTRGAISPSLLERLIDGAVAGRSEDGGMAPSIAQRVLEGIKRDLGWLLNTHSLDSRVDLTDYEPVRRSVLNFGMPSLSGRSALSIDALDTAKRIRRAIEMFEPRIRHVKVIPQAAGPDASDTTLRFRIEGDLMLAEGSTALVVDTQIALDSGDVRVLGARHG